MTNSKKTAAADSNKKNKIGEDKIQIWGHQVVATTNIAHKKTYFTKVKAKQNKKKSSVIRKMISLFSMCLFHFEHKKHPKFDWMESLRR